METKSLNGLFKQQIAVVSIGIETFYEDLVAQGVPAVQLNWSAPDEGQRANEELAERLAALLRR